MRRTKKPKFSKPLIQLAYPTRFERVTFAFGGQRSLYAASRGTMLSINRKNRVLRAPQPSTLAISHGAIRTGALRISAFPSDRVLRLRD